MADKKPKAKKSNSEISSSSSSSTSSFNSDEETETDFKPIKGYLSNRRELARQLFKSVKSEKIRMMLPQILKNMNMSDLEEWCASELCGMSEARILCILNGQAMLNSSETSETDDSGPSLEIISDTEEWLTDTEVAIKEEPSSSGVTKTKKSKAAKSKLKSQKKMDPEKLRARGKSRTNLVIESDVTVKKEKDKDNRGSTNKEGESLLDLLELEMRARAIRALIRKEEDIIPSEASEKRMALTTSALRNTLNSAVSASLSNEKNLNGKFDIDENDKKNSPVETSEKTTENVEDEDVVFVVVKPTPTIELLSSESENDDDTQKKKMDKNKSENSEKIVKTLDSGLTKNNAIIENSLNRDNAIAMNQRIVTIDKSVDGSDSLKIVITKRVSESSSPSSSKTSKTKKISIEKIESVKKMAASENSEKIVTGSELPEAGKGLFKKIRKKQHLRSKRKILTETVNRAEENTESSSALTIEKQSEDTRENEKPEVATKASIKIENESSEFNDSVIEKKKMEKKIISQPMDEDRLDDFEEIINLDDYSDDMDEIENDVDRKITDKSDKEISNERKVLQIVGDVTLSSPTKDPSESGETWASRYYQTDDVQNVIKESKIQSEIRKRLRERQRLSKISSSPKLNSPTDGTMDVDKSDEKIEPKPTGSVQEYLALKNSTAISAVNDAENTEEINKKIPDDAENTEEVDKKIPDDAENTEEVDKKVPDDAENTEEVNKKIPDDAENTEEINKKIPDVETDGKSSKLSSEEKNSKLSTKNSTKESSVPVENL